MAIDMALNHGTLCSERCMDVLRRYNSTAALRVYSPAGNDDLRAAIAASEGVAPENVMLANGSGPLLKTCIPFLIEKKIKSSLTRMARYALKRVAYPIITPRLTYSKVPASGVRLGLRCKLLPLSPTNGFALDVDHLAATLKTCDGLVYIASPNNPTGNVLLLPSEVEELSERFPESYFFIDEAYLHYHDDAASLSMVKLAVTKPNVIVTRSFSFAHGLAAARVGYAIGAPDLIAAMDAKLTPHRIGQLSADLAMAALADTAHLARVRRANNRERGMLMKALAEYSEIEAFDSTTNFILCRARGRGAAKMSGKQIADTLVRRGVLIKSFEPFAEERYDEYFRITVGLPAENAQLLEELDRLFGRVAVALECAG